MSGANIKAVVTAPDRPAGRGMQMQAPAVKQVALKAGLKVLQPLRLKDESFLRELKELEAELFVVVAFRMLPGVVFEMPPKGTINLHASLLPNLRGAAPIQWSIAYGLKETGLTTFFIEKEIDTGRIIRRVHTPINSGDTGGSLYERLMRLGPALLEETLAAIGKGETGTAQHDKTFASTEPLRLAPKFTPENTRIPFDGDFETIDCFCRALDPFPGAWCVLNKEKEAVQMKIFSIRRWVHTEAYTPLKKACSDGFWVPAELQEAGKKRMKLNDWLNGYGARALNFLLE